MLSFDSVEDVWFWNILTIGVTERWKDEEIYCCCLRTTSVYAHNPSSASRLRKMEATVERRSRWCSSMPCGGSFERSQRSYVSPIGRAQETSDMAVSMNVTLMSVLLRVQECFCSVSVIYFSFEVPVHFVTDFIHLYSSIPFICREWKGRYCPCWTSRWQESRCRQDLRRWQ